MKHPAYLLGLMSFGLFSCFDVTDGPPVRITVNFYESGNEYYSRADSMVISRKIKNEIISRNQMKCSGYGDFEKSSCNEWSYVLDSLNFDSVIVEGFVSKIYICSKEGYGRLAIPTPTRDIETLVIIGCL